MGTSFPPGTPPPGWRLLRALAAKPKAGRARAGAGSFIAFTRLYLYVHFPTDVLGGAVLGIALGTAAPHLQTIWRISRVNNKLYKNFRALFIPAAVPLYDPSRENAMPSVRRRSGIALFKIIFPLKISRAQAADIPNRPA